MDDKVKVVRDDLFQQDVDAIVNPANSLLLNGGGLAGLIAGLAGSALIAECRRKAPVPVGGAVSTTAGKLPFKRVIHAVGPVWGGGHYGEPELLRLAHQSALREASRLGLRSVAFPAVSCGLFLYPVAQAAPVAVGAVLDWLSENWESRVSEVRFCLVSEVHFRAFDDARRARAVAA